jgi:hypothetical protein
MFKTKISSLHIDTYIYIYSKNFDKCYLYIIKKINITAFRLYTSLINMSFLINI